MQSYTYSYRVRFIIIPNKDNRLFTRIYTFSLSFLIIQIVKPELKTSWSVQIYIRRYDLSFNNNIVDIYPVKTIMNVCTCQALRLLKLGTMLTTLNVALFLFLCPNHFAVSCQQFYSKMIFVNLLLLATCYNWQIADSQKFLTFTIRRQYGNFECYAAHENIN